MKLLVDPSEECDGAIGERMAYCLWFGALQEVVAITFLFEPCRTYLSVAFANIIRGEGRAVERGADLR